MFVYVLEGCKEVLANTFTRILNIVDNPSMSKGTKCTLKLVRGTNINLVYSLSLCLKNFELYIYLKVSFIPLLLIKLQLKKHCTKLRKI